MVNSPISFSWHQEDQTSSNLVDSANPASLSQSDADALTGWLKDRVLGERVKDVKVSTRLTTHPVVVTVPQLGAVRHFLQVSKIFRLFVFIHLVTQSIFAQLSAYAFT